jgi:fermentation-respiration switch protein FrsA (DUF1100 family)
MTQETSPAAGLDAAPRKPRSHLGTFSLTVILLAFFVAGASMTLVIWVTLSDFLAGHPVEGGRYLLAMALIGLFGALAWLLARYLQNAFLPEPRTVDRGDVSPSTEVHP